MIRYEIGGYFIEKTDDNELLFGHLLGREVFEMSAGEAFEIGRALVAQSNTMLEEQGTWGIPGTDFVLVPEDQIPDGAKGPLKLERTTVYVS